MAGQPEEVRASINASGTSDLYPSISPADVWQLLALLHHDPHSVLGAHPVEGGVIVRAFRPEAEKIELLVRDDAPREMVKVHDAGFFELLVEGPTDTFPYQFRVHYPEGNQFTLRDPYAFLPTLGSFDEHLFGEGRHERLYDKLGAHVRRLGDVSGVSFAVWAPNAGGVSVVGNFNNWDGRLHAMRMLGGSGIWEIFIPDIGAGEIYKYEIHNPGAPRFLKADPYALYSEIPPATSSIVFEPSYEFKDREWIEKRKRATTCASRFLSTRYTSALGGTSWKKAIARSPIGRWGQLSPITLSTWASHTSSFCL